MTRLSLHFLRSLFSHNNYDVSPLAPVTTTSQRVLGGILMLACILAFAPLSPLLPNAGLDPSWMFAINQAVAQNSVFGRDIVFTFGPYAAIYTQAYHPVTYPWMLTLGLLFGLSYTAMLLMAIRKQGNGWLWVYAVFLFLVDSRDALFFSYPLLVSLIAYKTTLTGMDPRQLAFTQRTRFGYALGIALLGVLPLIKGSFLPLSVVAALTGFILYWRKGERIFAPLFIGLPLLTMVVLWHMAGQPIMALPNYFRSMSPIISGYTEAMSIEGPTWQIAAYILVAILIMVSILRDRSNTILHTIALTSCVGLLLFIAFKAGFVRHDGHALAAGSALILAALALNIFSVARISLLIPLFAVTTWAIFHVYYVDTSLNQSPLPRLHGVLSGNHIGGRLQSAFDQRLDKIHKESSIPKLKGATDIYPYDQADLIASGNNWVSRPIPQSYSVYTPALARINEAHLRGPHAPDNIVFRVATIDRRFPSLDDGLSWPTLVSYYAISDTDKEYVYLKKRPVPTEGRKTVAMQGKFKLWENIALPQGEHILFAEIDVTPNFLGRLANVAFKTTPLYITVNLANGHRQTYRFIPGMARAGFIISPLIKSTANFIKIAEGQLPSLERNMVNSISIAPKADTTIAFWKQSYSLKISVMETNSKSALQQTISSTSPQHLPE